ncbi:unnamed protein product, partial [Phaeothamnion confervicola]
VAVDSSNRVLSCGYTNGNLGSTTNSGGADFWVGRINIDTASAMWQKQMGTSGDDKCAGVAAVGLSTGYVAAVGSTRGVLVSGITNSDGGMDGVVYMLDALTGSTKWSEQIHTDVTDSATAVAAFADGDIVVVGQTTGTLPDCGGCLLAGGSALGDWFAVRYDGATGAEVWKVQFGSANAPGINMTDADGLNSYEDTATAAAVDADGNVFVVGYTNGDMISALGGYGGRYGSYDPFVCKLDGNSGAAMWCFQTGTSNDDKAWALALAGGAADPVVCGQTKGGLFTTCNADDSNGADGPTCAGDASTSDWFCFRLPGSGSAAPTAATWSVQAGTTADDIARSAAVFSSGDGDVIVVGDTAGDLYGTNSMSSPICKQDAWAAEISASAGEVNVNQQWGSSCIDKAMAVATDGTDAVWVGYSDGGLFTTSSDGTNDFVAK